MSARKYFSREQLNDIKEAIRQAERDTSGEVRVHIEESCRVDVMDRAVYLFNKLGMAQTKQRNGVLIYLAIEDHKFSIIGDAGINAKVPEGFWDEAKTLMQEHFKQGQFSEGLCKAALMAGQQLSLHFPPLSNDTNELPDDVSFTN